MDQTRPCRPLADSAPDDLATSADTMVEPAAHPVAMQQLRLAALMLMQDYGDGASDVVVRGIYESIDGGDLGGARAWLDLLKALEDVQPSRRQPPGPRH